MTNKEKYIQLCANENYADKIPLFALPFWLDEVAENWDVCIVGDASTKLSMTSVIAVLPYCWKGNLITKRIYLPDLSFYQSVIFLKNDLSLKEKNKIAAELFKQLPKTVKSYFKFLPEYIDVDLSELNYQKEDYSTYIIDKKQQVLSLSTNHKRNIQKGIKQEYIVEESKNIDTSFALLTSTFERQHITSKINFDTFKKINLLGRKYNFGKTIDCFDKNKNLLASIFIVIDKQSAYYLLGGYSTEFKNSGAMTFLLHDVVQTAIKQQKDFNFCGSSKKGIATFFEGFGATKTSITIWKKSLL